MTNVTCRMSVWWTWDQPWPYSLSGTVELPVYVPFYSHFWFLAVVMVCLLLLGFILSTFTVTVINTFWGPQFVIILECPWGDFFYLRHLKIDNFSFAFTNQTDATLTYVFISFHVFAPVCCAVLTDHWWNKLQQFSWLVLIWSCAVWNDCWATSVWWLWRTRDVPAHLSGGTKVSESYSARCC